MALDAIGAGIDLADNLIKLFTPTISQEQKESLLNAFKSRVSEIQARGQALAANASDRGAQLDLRDLTIKLLNAAGFTAPGLASLDVNVPLDDYLQLLTAVALLVQLNEQSAVKS